MATKNKAQKDIDAVDTSFKRIEIDALKKFTDSQTLSGQLFWITLMLLFGVIMIYEVYKTISDYYNCPIKTSHTITTKDEMDFPTLYVCPPNVVRRTYLEQNRSRVDVARKLKFLMTGNLEDYEHVNQLMKDKLIDGSEDGHHLKRLHTEMGPLESDLFVFCTFRQSFTSKQILCKDLHTPVLDPEHNGKCYMINVGNRTQEFLSQALTLIYNIKSSEFPNGNEEDSSLVPKFLGLSIGVAAEFNPTNLHTVLVPGKFYTRFGLSKSRFEFLNVEHGEKYQPCADTDAVPFEILRTNYTASACKLDCFLRNVAKTCSCLTAVDEIFLKDDILNKYPYCTVNQLHKCLQSSNDQIQKSTDKCRTQCITACQGWRFNVRTSSMPLQGAAFPKMPNNDNTTTLADLAYIVIAFPYLEYDSFTQAKSLALDDAVSNVGGQINLWLGMSMFTVIEIPALTLMFCTCKGLSWWHKRRTAQQ